MTATGHFRLPMCDASRRLAAFGSYYVYFTAEAETV